ncbi:syntaxin-18 isoform X2 [Ahaetulla prasina]|uniref:syntaxin-18 isoform X2 n=1 Tax=Ahaetulla prasina TaxID=499056 RepID=UPI0026498644|nr:syntaxin-18 isoform X2 [Ahaetulla prasina]
MASAADITALFKASVKTVKTRNKALGVPPGGAEPAALWPRRAPRGRGGFSARAREVVNNIGKLKDFLLQHRKDYINAYSHLMSEYVRMSDTDRDQIDQDAQIFMRTCADAIQQLRAEAHKDIRSPQVKQHRETVLDFIADYLKRVCKLYSEQRAIRVKRVVDKKRLSRLEPEQSSKSALTASCGKAPETETEASPPPEELEEKLTREGSRERNLVDEHADFGLGQDSRGEDELSPEEIQMGGSSAPEWSFPRPLAHQPACPLLTCWAASSLLNTCAPPPEWPASGSLRNCSQIFSIEI